MDEREPGWFPLRPVGVAPAAALFPRGRVFGEGFLSTLRGDTGVCPSSPGRLRRRGCSLSGGWDFRRVSPRHDWEWLGQSHGRGDPGQPCHVSATWNYTHDNAWG